MQLILGISKTYPCIKEQVEKVRVEAKWELEVRVSCPEIG